MQKPWVLYAAIGFAGAACTLQVSSVATPAWLTSNDGIMSTGIGLWKVCLNLHDCADLTDSVIWTGWMQAVRIFGILAIVLLAAASLVGAWVVAGKLSKMALLPPTFAFAGECCCIVSFSVFLAKKGAWDADPFHLMAVNLGYSFALCVTSAGLAGVSGLLFLCGRKSGLFSDYEELEGNVQDRDRSHREGSRPEARGIQEEEDEEDRQEIMG